MKDNYTIKHILGISIFIFLATVAFAQRPQNVEIDTNKIKVTPTAGNTQSYPSEPQTNGRYRTNRNEYPHRTETITGGCQSSTERSVITENRPAKTDTQYGKSKGCNKGTISGPSQRNNHHEKHEYGDRSQSGKRVAEIGLNKYQSGKSCFGIG